MGAREASQRDREDRITLFHKVIACMDAKRALDPTILECARLPSAVLWLRNGYMLLFEQGSGHTIGYGQIRWHRDDSLRRRPIGFRIVRSKTSSEVFQLDGGPDRDLDVIAAELVESFLRRTE